MERELKREDLLAIDVGSELRTLCEAQLRGTWQVPAELVRFALRLGAVEIDVESRWLGCRIRWTGPTVDESVLLHLRSALDRRCPATNRQHAIGALEEAGADALLWAAGLRGARLHVDSDGSKGCFRFRHHDGGRPRLSLLKGGGLRPSVELRWKCARFDRRRSLAWVRTATRFVERTVTVNRSPVPRGFSDGLYHVSLNRPLPLWVALTRSGDRPVLWLLKNGVVSARAGISGYPPFEAAVELGGLVPGGGSAADLRRAVTPFVIELVERAVWMMVEVADRLGEMSEPDRDRIVVLLLRAARRKLREDEIREIPLIPTAGVAEDRLSVEDIRRLARRRGHQLAAIDPDAVSSGGVVDPETTLVTSSEIRDLLAELTSVRFQAPSRRSNRFRTRLGQRFRMVSERIARRLRSMGGARRVAPDALTEGEKALLTALRAADPSREIALCEGRGKVRTSSGGLVVPRHNPVVVAGAECVKGDSSWAYPVLLALDTGETPSEGLRERWRSL